MTGDRQFSILFPTKIIHARVSKARCGMYTGRRTRVVWNVRYTSQCGRWKIRRRKRGGGGGGEEEKEGEYGKNEARFLSSCARCCPAWRDPPSGGILILNLRRAGETKNKRLTSSTSRRIGDTGWRNSARWAPICPRVLAAGSRAPPRRRTPAR